MVATRSIVPRAAQPPRQYNCRSACTCDATGERARPGRNRFKQQHGTRFEIHRHQVFYRRWRLFRPQAGLGHGSRHRRTPDSKPSVYLGPRGKDRQLLRSGRHTIRENPGDLHAGCREDGPRDLSARTALHREADTAMHEGMAQSVLLKRVASTGSRWL